MDIVPYWYRSKVHPLLYPLLPFSWAFQGIAGLRRVLFRLGLRKTHQLKVPVIVVGNITVGGTGKTPFVAWLTNTLKEQGKNPGIALRGAGGKKHHQPISVTAYSDPLEAGDEAVLLAKKTFCPVVACIDRVAAVNELIQLGCNVVICDDGLQHYRLGRDLEIAVIDGHRYFGNRAHLPAGPLREPLRRLNKVDFIVINQPRQLTTPDSHYRVDKHTTYPMQLEMDCFVPLEQPLKPEALTYFANKKVHAVAGIGNPRRFFDMLRSLDITIVPHIFPDHHPYQASELDFKEKLPIIMTEKDAIKCRHFAKDKLWALRVKPVLGINLKTTLLAKINELMPAEEQKEEEDESLVKNQPELT